MKIGIIGNGFVGKATKQLECNDIEVLSYDINPELCSPKGLTSKILCESCDIIFVSVPTPMNTDGSCYLGIIDNVISDLKQYIDFNKKIVVLRSTIPPGTSEKYNCFFMPEFLTEKNYINDFINNKNWIFGTKKNEQDSEFIKKITELFNLAFINNKIKYNNLLFCSSKEAEMIKYVRNCFLSVKISFFNEIHEFCEKKNIDFDTVREYATLDDRIGSSHTHVPGHDGKYGYGGTCFPKDMNSLNNEMKLIDMKSYIISNSILRNENIDRVDKDWLLNKGRSTI